MKRRLRTITWGAQQPHAEPRIPDKVLAVMLGLDDGRAAERRSTPVWRRAKIRARRISQWLGTADDQQYLTDLRASFLEGLKPGGDGGRAAMIEALDECIFLAAGISSQRPALSILPEVLGVLHTQLQRLDDGEVSTALAPRTRAIGNRWSRQQHEFHARCVVAVHVLVARDGRALRLTDKRRAAAKTVSEHAEAGAVAVGIKGFCESRLLDWLEKHESAFSDFCEGFHEGRARMEDAPADIRHRWDFEQPLELLSFGGDGSAELRDKKLQMWLDAIMPSLEPGNIERSLELL